MRSIYRSTIGQNARLIEVQACDDAQRLYNVYHGRTGFTALTQAEAEEVLGRFIFAAMRDEGRLAPPAPPEITVDYVQLAAQRNIIAKMRLPRKQAEMIDGVLNFLDRVIEVKPFREVKDK